MESHTKQLGALSQVLSSVSSVKRCIEGWSPCNFAPELKTAGTSLCRQQERETSRIPQVLII